MSAVQTADDIDVSKILNPRLKFENGPGKGLILKKMFNCEIGLGQGLGQNHDCEHGHQFGHRHEFGHRQISDTVVNPFTVLKFDSFWSGNSQLDRSDFTVESSDTGFYTDFLIGFCLSVNEIKL